MKRPDNENQFRRSTTSSRRRLCLKLCCCLILIACIGSSCKRNQNSSTSRTPAELDEATRSYLRHQLQLPDVMGGSTESEFIKKHYLPGLASALESLDDLEAAKLDVVPVAAFVRPYAGHTVLWMMWVQLDAGKRTVSLYDDRGEFSSFSVPTTGSTTPGHSYLRFSVVRLINNPSDQKPDPNDPTLNIPVRPFDIHAVKLLIHAPEGDQKRSPAEMPAVYYPLETPVTTRATEGNAAQRIAQQHSLREEFDEAGRVVRQIGIEKVIRELESSGVSTEASQVLAVEAARHTKDARLKPFLKQIANGGGPVSKFAQAALEDYSP